MTNPSGAHEALRQEWREEPPDLSYSYVVSYRTLRRALSVLHAVRKKKINVWVRIWSFVSSFILQPVAGVLVIALAVWLSFEVGKWVDRQLAPATPFGSSHLVIAVICLTTFLAIMTAWIVVLRLLVRVTVQQVFREFFTDNVFIVEGRKSHLWFDEKSAGAIRRWSTFDELVEFDGGMWLLLRRRTTFAGLRGILITKESLSGSCAWSELQGYIRQRLQGYQHEA